MQGEHHMRMEEEMGIMQPQAKEHKDARPPSQEDKGSSTMGFRKNLTLPTP
jgi:hypothetical protein